MFSCFSLEVYLPQNIDMSLSQVQWYSQKKPKPKNKTKQNKKQTNKQKIFKNQ